ncbi:MAG: L,D-transpeptidase [Gemmatimonadota bacterium]
MPAADPGAGLEALRQEHEALLAELDRRAPKTPYVVIDTRTNRLQVRTQEETVLRDAVCATGAARRFEGRKSYQRWTFASPTGRFAVLRKEADPLWVKPTWAFLEAAEDVPVLPEDRRRFQRGVLGRFALYFAPDYMIHGTLYEINLGKSITHGCVRVGSEDLEYLYQNVEVGWPVYLY